MFNVQSMCRPGGALIVCDAASTLTMCSGHHFCINYDLNLLFWGSFVCRFV